jgi:AhpD family alkylhydroperoxidase
MDARQKELIAVGAAVTAHCIPCFRFHVEKAQDAGAAREEIAEAIRIGRQVRAGSAKTWDTEAAEIFPESGR